MSEKSVRPLGKRREHQSLAQQLRRELITISFCPGVWDHISGVMGDVCDLEQRVQRAKDNIEEIQSVVHSWGSPIFERRDSKRESVLSLEECQERLERRYSLVRDSGQRIHSLLKVRGHLQGWGAPQRLRGVPVVLKTARAAFP